MVFGVFGYVQVFSYKAKTDPWTNIKASIYQSGDLSTVIKTELIIITPVVIDNQVKPLYFIPGGLVEPYAYIDTMEQIAIARKSAVYIQKPLLNLAITNINQSVRIIKDYGIDKPIIGGHSLGGVVACRNIASNPELFSGLLLIGSYCDASITGFGGQVNVVHGSNDKILSRDNFEKNRGNLPMQVAVREVPGLNHSGLFDYGLQKGDGEMTIDKGAYLKILSGAL